MQAVAVLVVALAAVVLTVRLLRLALQTLTQLVAAAAAVASRLRASPRITDQEMPPQEPLPVLADSSS